MTITRPAIRLTEEELSILERARDICASITDNCPDLDFPCENFATYADNACGCLDDLIGMYCDHINEED